MKKPKQYSLSEVFNAANIGVIFEFYSSKNDDFIIKDLNKLTTKNIVLTNSDYDPSFSNAILMKEYNGKKPKYYFKIAPQNFKSIIPIVTEVLEWLSETSECTADTLMRVNMSFNNRHLETLQTISGMSTDKLILKFNEDYVYERFPEQKGSSYTMSIKELLPFNENLVTNDIVKNVNYIIGLPQKNYYGINFENYTRGILEFNYIGGKNYSEKNKEILELLEYYVIKTYQSLNELEYSRDELRELRELTNTFYKIQEAYYEPAQFFKLFPDIKVSVDVKYADQVIKSYWPKIRNTLFEVVVNGHFKKGEFNLDTNIGKYQLRNAELKSSKISNFDLVRCNIQGIVENCNLWTCEVNNARLYNSKIVRGTDIKNSYLHKVTVNRENSLENCIIENMYEIINCKITESIVKFAGIGKDAKLDENTVIIDQEDKITQKLETGIFVEQIRDYKWIKELTGKKEEGHVFGNEYVKKKYI